MPGSDSLPAGSSTGASTKSFWTIIQTFVSSIVLGCFFGNLKNGPTGYAHYFPEGDGYLYVTHVGSGNQGAALLVRSVSDQQNYVRKRKKFPSMRFTASNEAAFALPHDNIPKCILQTPYEGVDRDGFPSRTTADIFAYCNGGNLQRVINIAKDKNTPVPSAFVWRLFRQLLGAVLYVNSKKILHRDIKGDNIFLHWKDNTSLPDFFLGDFGIACRLVTDLRGQVRTMDTVKVLELVKLCVNPKATSLNAVPAPPGREGESFAALFRYFDKFEEALYNFSGSRDDSAALDVAMRDLERELKVDGVAWEQETGQVDLGEYRVETATEPLLFETEDALLAGRFPPGPWQVAKVQKKRGAWKVVEVAERRYCGNEAEFT